MRNPVLLALLAATPLLSHAAGKSCEELKGEIQAKLDVAHVQKSSLEIVAKGAATTGKVVGHCEGGSKQIVYTRQ